jgi:ubiquinone/menaquinone biosynthesis C-methylase UbiE
MSDAFQLSRAAALKYDEHMVPALFAPLAKATMDRIALPDGASVIDIACGTGALTREIAARLGEAGRLVGTDLNATMIEVACERHPADTLEAEYLAADVSSLPYEDGSFDYAFLQQGLQFFPDKPAALHEIARVLRPGGCLVLSCWRAISPFSQALANSIGRHIGEAAAAKASAPFSFRDGDTITQLLQVALFEITRHDAIILERQFTDLRAQIFALPVEKDLVQAGEAVITAVIQEVEADLSDYADGNTYLVPQEAYLFSAAKLN